MKGRIRHEITFRVAWTLLHKYFAHKFNFEYEIIEPDYSPYIVISNHLTNWDPILIGLSFRRGLYYVSTDHVFRMGWKSVLLKFFFSPIPRAKTVHETSTVINIFRRLKDKCSICIFAEGNTSYDGETGEVPRSTGKLIKKAGVTLITYRFTGSYFSFPRWSRFLHRGKMSGRLVNVYSPEKIAGMSEDEIYKAIISDIYVNAYEEQEKNPVAFIGKKPAESLETALYCCPECRQFASLTSKDDMLFCKCGFRVRFNEYGNFEYPSGQSGIPPFTTVLDWSKWQKNEMSVFAEKALSLESDVPVFTDPDQELFQIKRARKNILLCRGTLCMYNDRVSIITNKGNEKIDFPLETIIDMSIITRMTLIFITKDNLLFEIHSKHPRSALKYMDLFFAIKNKKELT